MPDKFTATWVSHSSIADFLNCPRAYYLKNVYRNPKTNHKIQLMSPSLALGSAVHEVIESLSLLPVDKRFEKPLLQKFAEAWKKVTGKRGGFLDSNTEESYKRLGEDMLKMVQENPGPIAKKAVKINSELPQYWLSEEDEIILCGKIDWLEYLPDTDSVHIIDFKTSKNAENESSLQLPIYLLLVHNTQERQVAKASYWYLRLHKELDEKVLPDLEEARKQVLQVAKQVKTARKLNHFKCPQGSGGCWACRPLELVAGDKAELVGTNAYNQDIFILREQQGEETEESMSSIL